MTEITPRITIEGEDMDYLQGDYVQPGNLGAATLTFSLPLSYAGDKKLWNKEVLMFLNKQDSAPIFRGYIRRTKNTFNEIEVFAQDAIGYLIEDGDTTTAQLNLTETDNLDGLSVSAAIQLAIKKAQLTSRLGVLGNTSPVMSVVRPPIRGTIKLLDIIKTLLSKAVLNTGTIPRPNIARLIDNGKKSLLLIELQADLDTSPIVHSYSELNNILSLDITNRKIPSVLVVNGKNGVAGTFAHDSAISAFDRNYLTVSNDSLESPAECKDFAQKLFKANEVVQYEYGILTLEGAYLMENDVIRVETDDPKFSGNFRVIGKKVSFSPSSYSVGLNINRKPPTLAEYISSRDN
jgi:hypothetical protein|tara:strand:+ start:1713 stop:2759 length:1047 start_codon:yes stop_codon:yes gene_type:complete